MILKWIFNKLDPERGTNWLSVRFHRWNTERHERNNDKYKEGRGKEDDFFYVAGAGEICVKNGISYTGGAAGFSISISWSKYGLGCGGVLGITEARRLAYSLLQKCNAESRTEEEIQEEGRKNMEAYFDNLYKNQPS